MRASRRLVPAVALVLVASSGAVVEARAGETQEGTPCTFAFDITFSPGVSETPTSGTHTSGGQTGAVECDGPVNGKQPTGPGTFGESGRYGTVDPDTCTGGGEGDGVDTLVFPTADGTETIKSPFTAEWGEISTRGGGVVAGRFEGERYSGTLELTPTDGDCLSRPMTKGRVIGEGILHD